MLSQFAELGQTVEAQVEQLRAENRAYCTSLEEELAQYHSETRQLQMQITELKTTIVPIIDSDKRIDLTLKHVDALEGKIEGLYTAIQHYETEIEVQMGELRTRARVPKQDNEQSDDITHELGNIKEEMSQMKDELRILGGQLTHATSQDVTQVKVDLEDVRDAMTQVKAALKNMDGCSNCSSRSRPDDMRRYVDKQIGSVTLKVDSVSDDLCLAKSTISELRTKYNRLTNTAEKLDSQYCAAIEQTKRTNEKLQGVLPQIESMKSSVRKHCDSFWSGIKNNIQCKHAQIELVMAETKDYVQETVQRLADEQVRFAKNNKQFQRQIDNQIGTLHRQVESSENSCQKACMQSEQVLALFDLNLHDALMSLESGQTARVQLLLSAPVFDYMTRFIVEATNYLRPSPQPSTQPGPSIMVPQQPASNSSGSSAATPSPVQSLGVPSEARGTSITPTNSNTQTPQPQPHPHPHPHTHQHWPVGQGSVTPAPLPLPSSLLGEAT
eukprot:TRINITY_DN63772_c0_g1_i1.p1 TRINITY_DN63772_c0_g1~~TRINITY_DN63772_c0_g1_i1.p1  ORF type:complete len:498 (+),score=46.15 TRINITY_DN63772_c0_g1_i1:420-1913(+)